MKPNCILLDMDGVVVHHFKALGALFGLEIGRDNWPEGKTKIKEITGTPPNEFNATVIAAGADLWASMQPFTWTKSFVAALEAIAPVYYLSSPDYGPPCLAGKLIWLEAMHGAGFDRFILTQHKPLLAAPGRLLIDDMPSNVEKFRAAGGQALLFQQPWNGHTDPAPDQTCLKAIAAL